jgi:hypothetical protein
MYQATCTRDGNIGYRTTVTDPDAHKWGGWIQLVAPTETTKGLEERYCIAHNYIWEEREIGFTDHVHQWGAWTRAIEPDCLSGLDRRTCSVDSSHIESRTVPATQAHVWGAWTTTTPATTTSEGIETRTCTNVASRPHSETRRIPILPFASVSDLSTWLADQDDNTASTPYNVRLGGSDLTGIVAALDDKYVNLDLSENTTSSIAVSAFSGATTLVGITFPDGVTSIGATAFLGCTNLTSVTIPSSVETMGVNAFANSGLTSVTIESGVTIIGNNAFYNCTNLSRVTIPSTVIGIGEGAFRQCTSLASVTIPAGVLSIGTGAFANSGLASLTIPNSVVTIGNSAFDSTSITSVTIPASVSTIGANAFNDCSSLTSVTFVGDTTTIANNNSFPDGTSLKTAYEDVSDGGAGTYRLSSGTWTKS